MYLDILIHDEGDESFRSYLTSCPQKHPAVTRDSSNDPVGFGARQWKASDSDQDDQRGGENSQGRLEAK